MLDVQHSCDLVSSLGGYTRASENPAPPDAYATPPADPEAAKAAAAPGKDETEADRSTILGSQTSD